MSAAPEAGFEAAVAAHRSELVAFCYRMVGSPHDAEELVQETFLRAWRAQDRYDAARASPRTWLYRIATNVCLTALEGRQRRPLPAGLVAASDPHDPLTPGEVPWLQPLPMSVLGADPESAAIDRGTLRLAFAAALQRLSARERAALILRDVLGFPAAEAAGMLGSSTAAVNSALQRARSRLRGLPGGEVATPAADERARVEQYVRAFERADIAGLTGLLAREVVMEMPPMINWFAGLDHYAAFMDWVYATNGTDWRCRLLEANGGHGFAAYRRLGRRYALHTVQVLTATGAGIVRNSVFVEPDVFAAFGLAAELPSEGVGQ